MDEKVRNKRVGTRYPGIFYRIAKRKGKAGTEKVFYAVYWEGSRKREVKVGREFADDMTPARAAGMRARLIENEIKPPQDRRGKRRRVLPSINCGRNITPRIPSTNKPPTINI